MATITKTDFSIRTIDAVTPYKIIDAQSIILKPVSEFILEIDGYQPRRLPGSTLQQAQTLFNTDPTNEKMLKGRNYKIIEKAGSVFVARPESEILAARPALNEFQAMRMRDDIQKSPLVRVLTYSAPKLNIHVIDGYFTFSQGYAGWVRANFHFSHTSEPVIELMRISGFAELISDFFKENEGKYSEWMPVVTAQGVQIKVDLVLRMRAGQVGSHCTRCSN